jgi:hypothetical protein
VRCGVRRRGGDLNPGGLRHRVSNPAPWARLGYHDTLSIVALSDSGPDRPYIDCTHSYSGLVLKPHGTRVACVEFARVRWRAIRAGASVFARMHQSSRDSVGRGRVGRGRDDAGVVPAWVVINGLSYRVSSGVLSSLLCRIAAVGRPGCVVPAGSRVVGARRVWGCAPRSGRRDWDRSRVPGSTASFCISRDYGATDRGFLGADVRLPLIHSLAN